MSLHEHDFTAENNSNLGKNIKRFVKLVFYEYLIWMQFVTVLARIFFRIKIFFLILTFVFYLS